MVNPARLTLQAGATLLVVGLSKKAVTKARAGGLRLSAV